ncbi:hypothetical protein OBBRIDRAFT_257875 [Obba rivulosa]|uniref:Uncharacterized protein n=1 Tax=Obba rivulosa TaxID=1052685 RepID=A0A8E2DGP9_9APHY|nr:hypothetical protein OBBRIDRAFT_257875 [Obba rivulosa]
MATCTFAKPESVQYLPCGRKMFKVNRADGGQDVRVVRPGGSTFSSKHFDAASSLQLGESRLRGASYWQPINIHFARDNELPLLPISRRNNIESPLLQDLLTRRFWNDVGDNNPLSAYRLLMDVLKAGEVEEMTKAIEVTALAEVAKVAEETEEMEAWALELIEAMEAMETMETMEETMAQKEAMEAMEALEVLEAFEAMQDMMQAMEETTPMGLAMAAMASEPAYEEHAVDLDKKAEQKAEAKLDCLATLKAPRGCLDSRGGLDAVPEKVEGTGGIKEAAAGEAGMVAECAPRPSYRSFECWWLRPMGWWPVIRAASFFAPLFCYVPMLTRN